VCCWVKGGVSLVGLVVQMSLWFYLREFGLRLKSLDCVEEIVLAIWASDGYFFSFRCCCWGYFGFCFDWSLCSAISVTFFCDFERV